MHLTPPEGRSPDDRRPKRSRPIPRPFSKSGLKLSPGYTSTTTGGNGSSPSTGPTKSSTPSGKRARSTRYAGKVQTVFPTPSPPPSIGQPITGPTDPRWVLAIRTSEVLQGSILPPEKREGLLRVGRAMGLTSFDANLVIAIVQDQARRGYAPEYCPTAGEEQLTLVPLPGSKTLSRARRPLLIATIVSSIILVEIVLLKLVFG